MKKNYFTLIELISVITITSLLAVVAYPLFSTNLSNWARLNSCAELFRSDFRYLQNLALINDNPSIVYTLRNDSTSYTLLENGTPSSKKWPGNMDNNRSLGGITLLGNNLTFDRLGKITTNQTYTFAQGGSNVVIQISANGSISP